MERINIPASMQNVQNVERLHSRETVNPIIQTVQNSEVDKAQRETKMRQPNEVDAAENLIVDPDERKKQEKRKKKKPDGKNRGKSSGKFIDYTA